VPTVRTANGSAGSNGLAAQAVTLPSGWLAGDVVIGCIIARNTGTPNTWTVDQGFTKDVDAENSGDSTNGHAYCHFSKVMAGNESNPTLTYGGGTNSRFAYAVAAIRPSSGGLLSINNRGTPVVTTVATSTTIANPSVAATGSATGLSSVVILTCDAVAAVTGSIVAVTPTSWVIPTLGQVSSAGGTTAATRAVCAAVTTRDAQSGTVSPTTWSFTQTSGTFWQGETGHYLIQETARPPSLVVGRW
jgi:hypothetical protein